MSLEDISDPENPETMEENTPAKRVKLTDSFVSQASSALRFSKTGSLGGTVILYTSSEINQSPASMDELVRSPGIVLTIGPEQVQTTVQSSLFRGISEPLHNLLNHSIENPTIISEALKDDDKDAFLALVSMAYSVVLKGLQGQATTTPISMKALSTSSTSSGDNIVQGPTNCPECKKGLLKFFLACESCNTQGKNQDGIGLDTFFELQFAQQGPPELPQYLAKSRIPLPTSLDTKNKSTGKKHGLLHFAKVFTLATKYEVWGLQYNAVKAFDRRLKRYATDENKKNDEMFEVLKYLASAVSEVQFSPVTSTAPATPVTVDSFDVPISTREVRTKSGIIGINPTTLLRRLLGYIVAHVESLLDEEEFREIVVEHGIIGLELMYVLKQNMAAFDE